MAGKRPHSNRHEFHWIVIRRDAVGGELATDSATVDNRPLSVIPDPDADGVHLAVAGGGAVTGLIVNVNAGQAVGAVISVIAARTIRNNRPAALFAGERIRAGMFHEIVPVQLPFLVLSVHSL